MKLYTIREIAKDLNITERIVYTRMQIMGIKGIKISAVLYFDYQDFCKITNRFSFDNEKYNIFESKMNFDE